MKLKANIVSSPHCKSSKDTKTEKYSRDMYPSQWSQHKGCPWWSWIHFLPYSSCTHFRKLLEAETNYISKQISTQTYSTWTSLRLSEGKSPPFFVTPQPVQNGCDMYFRQQIESTPATLPSSSPPKLWSWEGRQTGGKARRSTRSPDLSIQI